MIGRSPISMRHALNQPIQKTAADPLSSIVWVNVKLQVGRETGTTKSGTSKSVIGSLSIAKANDQLKLW